MFTEGRCNETKATFAVKAKVETRIAATNTKRKSKWIITSDPKTNPKWRKVQMGAVLLLLLPIMLFLRDVVQGSGTVKTSTLPKSYEQYCNKRKKNICSLVVSLFLLYINYTWICRHLLFSHWSCM